MATRLTDTAVAKVLATGKRFAIYDADVSGFGLMVQASGAKSFFCEYRPIGSGRGGSKRRVVLGSTDVLKAHPAREKARELLASVRLGNDPAGERAEQRKALTLKEVADMFMSEHVELKRKAGTKSSYRLLIDKHIIPAIGAKKLTEVTGADVSRIHGRLSKKTPTTANRCVAVIGSLWTWASRRKFVDHINNPARGIERNREEGRERFLSDDELGRLGATLRLAETDGLPWIEPEDEARSRVRSKHARLPENRRTVIDPRVVAVIRLLLLTGARLREILHLSWSEIDFERGMIVLGHERSKTGKKAITLSAAALSVLAGLPREGGNVLVFPGPGGGPRADLKKPWDLIRAHAALEDVRLHDLRHSNASVAAGASIPLHTIAGLLGHRQVATTQRYAHLSTDPLRRAADTVADRLLSAMGDKLAEDRPSAEVVPLRR